MLLHGFYVHTHTHTHTERERMAETGNGNGNPVPGGLGLNRGNVLQQQIQQQQVPPINPAAQNAAAQLAQQI